MPTYQMTGKDGKTYQINGPAGLKREQVVAEILKRAPQAGVAPEQKRGLENIPYVGGALASAADIPLSFVEGLAGTGKTFTDVFGANNRASNVLNDISNLAAQYHSAGSRQDAQTAALIQKQAEGKGIWEEVKAAARSFALAPAETTASVVGSAVPFVAAALAAPATEGASLIPALSAAGLGAVSGVGTIKGDIRDAVYAKFKEAGVSDEQAAAAADKAQSYGGANLDQIALGGVIGALASATGLPRQISSAIGRETAEQVVARAAAREAAERAGEQVAKRSVITGAAKGAAEEALPEALQAGHERYAQNTALQREGFDVDRWKGVAGQAAFEGIASLVMGAYGGAKETRAENREALGEELKQTFNDMPEAPSDADKATAATRFTRWGMNQETADTIVARMAAAKESIAAKAQQMEEELAAARAERTAGVEPGAEPDLTEAPPVDAEEEAARYAAYAQEAGAPEAEVEAPPVQEPTTAPTITPAQAASILQDDAAVDRFAEQFGIDREEAVDRLTQAAETGIKYSRGRRAKDTETQSLFGEMPTQEAPGEALKRDEFNALRFAPEEQKAALREQAAQEAEATQERLAAKETRESEQRDETLGDIEYALRAQAPENAVYKVDYNPEDTKAPYKLVAERTLGEAKPEVILSAPTLKDFSDAVYGQMEELTPYVPPAELSAQTVEAPDTTEPTVATSLIQQFTGEVDAAREAGQIDNNQRAELLGRLERPDAYRTLPNGQVKPNDAIAKLEAEATKATEAFRNADNDEARIAASQQLNEVNQRLTNAVQNALLNPLRASLKSMVETRQDERLGAAQRKGNARVQEALGRAEGRDVSPERREQREAAIEERETQVQKYKRGERTTGINANVVTRIANSLAASWKGGVNIQVVKDVASLPKNLRNALEADGATDAKGFVTPDGTVYLLADNITSEEDARAVLFHEGLGHVGLAKLFREKLDTVLRSLYDGNKTLREDANAWLRDNPDAYANDPRRIERAVEEVLAERSEQGVIPQSVMQRLVALVRDFARRIGFDLDVSDADVAAVLAQAHQRVTKGDSKSAALAGMRYILGRKVPKAQQPKTTFKTKAELLASAGDVSDGLRRTLDSQNTYSMGEGIGDAIRGHSDKPFIAALKENFNALKPSALKATLISLPTSGVLDWFGGEIHALKEVDKLVSHMTNMKANIIQAGNELAKKVDSFVNKHGSELLASVQSISRINEVGPDEFASMAEALDQHPVVKLIQDRILANSNDKAKAQQIIDALKALAVEGKSRETLKGETTRFTAEANKLLSGLEATAIDQTKTTDQAKQLTEITRRIRDVYTAWDALGQQPGGQQLYKEMRTFYKDMFEAELALLDERIEQVADKEQALRLRDMRAQLMRETLEPDAAKKAGDIFWDVDASLFQKDYFPFMREGKYWLYVKGKPNGERERQFYTFSTAKELNRAKEALARKYGVDPDSNEDFTAGNDIATLQENFRNEDALMQKVFDIVGKEKERFDTTRNIDLKEMIDAIYQTWLMTTPERSVRRRLMHADEVTGFSSDVLNHLSRQVTAYANQLSKMAYAGRIRNEIKGAYESISDRPVEERRKLETAVHEMEQRAEQEINPTPQSAIVNLLNRASFFYYLTSAKTALVQTLSIPMRTVPRLWKDYGYAKGTAMWVKYMNVYKTLGFGKLGTEHNTFGDELHAVMPSVLNSSLLTKGPRAALLQRAAAAAKEHNLLQTVTDTLVQSERETAKKQRRGLNRVTAEVAAESGKVMSAMFNGMENISRQISFFMGFELAYDDFKAKNPKATEDAAFEHAMEQATSVVRDTLGEFTSWERPRLAKNNLTRAAFLFKMHSVIQTKFFVQNFRAITKGLFSDWGKDARAARAGAARELTGVLMMAGLFGGITGGLPLYSLMAWALAEGFDDEDDDDVRRLMGLDPRVAYDSDIMFRKWLAERIGNPAISDMLIHGPISAITNTDIGSSTSIDFKNMWFREAVAGDSTEMNLMKTVFSNVAGLNLLSQWANGYDDFANGDIAAGLKKSLPAFGRSWVTAAQMASEGVKDRKGNVLIRKEDITSLDEARALLGFRPMDLAQWQDYYITASKNEKQIESRKKRILDRLEKAIDDGDIASQADLNTFLKDEVVPFNRTYPDPSFVITEDTIQRSLKGRAKVRAMTVQGMQLSRKTAAKEYEMAKPFMMRR